MMRDNASLLLIALVIVLAAVLLLGGPRATHPLVGQPAPDLNLELLDGGALDLAAHQGSEIVMLDFWATWCAPCRSSMPAVEEVAQEFADQGVVLYAVNQNESPAAIKRFLAAEGLDVTVALDPGWQAGRADNVEGIPQLVIIGKDGVIQSIHVGAGPGMRKELRRELDRLVNKGTLLDTDKE